MKVIVGLGNPGRQYQATRHNIGFAVVDELAARAGVAFDASPANALVARWRAREVLLVKPLTFMNASGEAVGAVLRYYKVDAADTLVIVDDTQLPLGRLRLRSGGSAGGHNGLKSIAAHLGDQVPRLRVGVGRGDDRRDLADHVLSTFDPHEAGDVVQMTTRAADAAEMFIASGIATTMNQFNGDPSTESSSG